MERFEPVLFAKTLDQWRAWLGDHGKSEPWIYLVIFKKASGVESVGWYQAIEHALCFGWVDSIAHTRDDQSVYLKFTPRKASSTWGKRNIERVERLTAEGWMRPEGQALVDAAKLAGKWKPEHRIGPIEGSEE